MSDIFKPLLSIKPKSYIRHFKQMRVYRSLNELPVIKNAIVTQGTFDGVHIAHKVIINRVKELAKQRGGETVLMTFDPHPRLVLHPENHDLKLLNTLAEKITALEKEGIDHLIVLPFTKAFSEQTSLQFIRDIIVNKIGTKVLVIGYDHRFGKNREGTFEHLKEFATTYGFEVEEIPEQDVDEVAISSTRIRKALEAGDVLGASKYLGRFYEVSGKVIKGKQLGRTIGYPTANIKVPDANKQLPADGVYAVEVFFNNKWYGAMLNSGYRPTVDGKAHAIEAHIFDFNEDVYNQTITLKYVDKLRDEMKFNGLDELKNQLEKDKLRAIAVLQKADND